MVRYYIIECVIYIFYILHIHHDVNQGQDWEQNMATKNETLLLSGGVTYEEKNKNTKEELDVKAKDIEVTVNNIARVERIIKNLPDFSDTSIDIKPFYDELIDIELKNLITEKNKNKHKSCWICSKVKWRQ